MNAAARQRLAQTLSVALSSAHDGEALAALAATRRRFGRQRKIPAAAVEELLRRYNGSAVAAE